MINSLTCIDAYLRFFHPLICIILIIDSMIVSSRITIPLLSVCMQGATIVDQIVTITRAENYVPQTEIQVIQYIDECYFPPFTE